MEFCIIKFNANNSTFPAEYLYSGEQMTTLATAISSEGLDFIDFIKESIFDGSDSGCGGNVSHVEIKNNTAYLTLDNSVFGKKCAAFQTDLSQFRHMICEFIRLKKSGVHAIIISRSNGIIAVQEVSEG